MGVYIKVSVRQRLPLLPRSMDEKVFDEIVDFVKNGNYPVSMKNDKNKKRNFRRKCEPFIFDDGLYYKKISLSERLKVMSNTLNLLYVTYVSHMYLQK